MEIQYRVSGEKLLRDGNIEKTTSAYSWDQFLNAQALLARLILDEGYEKAQIETLNKHT